jgi:hypothetical protein
VRLDQQALLLGQWARLEEDGVRDPKRWGQVLQSSKSDETAQMSLTGLCECKT